MTLGISSSEVTCLKEKGSRKEEKIRKGKFGEKLC